MVGVRRKGRFAFRVSSFSKVFSGVVRFFVSETSGFFIVVLAFVVLSGRRSGVASGC